MKARPVILAATATHPRCADCGELLEGRVCRSFYFARPLCPRCYVAEQDRPYVAAERWVLERMFTQPLPSGDPD